MKWKQSGAIFALLLLLSCWSMGIASAHRVHVEYTLSEIEIYAYYGGGSGDPIRDGRVTVKDGEGNLYLNGTTDAEGKFRFPPKIGMDNYTVHVESTHMPGHRGETTIARGQEVSGAGGVAAEMPLYTRIIAGFGYLIGAAGAAMAYMGWKWKKKYGKQE
jgi:nickel transport protein